MPATIFKGSKVKTLKGTLTLNDAADIVTGTTNPQTSAVDAPAGSLYLKTDSGDVYRKLDSGSSTNWLLVGSEGSAGINLVGLNSAYQLQSPTDRNAEVSVGNWATYDDGAVATPVDMTGGAPAQITLSRTTTAGEVLNGVASFKVVKAAADGQGEGWSVVCNVPEGYRGRQVAIKFPFKLISGTLADGDLKLYGYDVTNSVVLDPVNNSVVGSRGSAIALFSTSTSTAQIRIGFHLATTAATAFTIAWDDFEVTPTAEALGVPSSEWTNNTGIVVSGAGTITNHKIYSRRVGDSLEIRGSVTYGTIGGSNMTLDLPSGLAIDTLKMANTTNTMAVGWAGKIGAGASNLNTDDAAGAFILFYDGSDSSKLYFSRTFSGSQYSKQSSSTILGESDKALAMWGITVPIAGWSSNVSIASSSTFKMSSILANGTRVTTTPTRLGEYRSKYKSASSNDYTAWTDTAPTAAPSSVDGMRLYSDNFSAAGTAGEPNAYEIFVGKNKNVFVNVFKSAALTGALSFEYATNGASSAIGVQHNYDPTTGVLYVSAGTHGGATTATTYLGWDQAAALNYADGYFDVIVSDNALAVGIQAPSSQVLAHTGNGHGSTNTKIRRFTTAVSVGSAITYADSATLGASFTINESGVYVVSYSDTHTANANIGISVDSSTLTTNIQSVSIANGKKAITSIAANLYANVGVPLKLAMGAVIRPHTDGVPTDTTDNVVMTVTQVSKG